MGIRLFAKINVKTMNTGNIKRASCFAKKIKMAINIKRKRITHLKQELHYQCANFISKRYGLIMMPKLEAV